MTPFRHRMREAMHLRGLAERTQATYRSAVQQVALPYAKSPDLITADELRHSFLFLCHHKRLAPNRTNVALNAIKFVYTYTLQRPWPLRDLLRPPVPNKRPVVLAPHEVWRIIEHGRRPHYRVCLCVFYACGLRLLEGVTRLVSQIDSARLQLHLRSGKGNTDRAIPLPERTLTRLRAHWRMPRTPIWLFPGAIPLGAQHAKVPMEESGFQKAFRKAVQAAGVNQPATIHSLRHAWATHLLESGVRVRVLQLWMGHSSPTTTASYPQLTQHAEQAAARARERLTAGLP
jgi:site-specific recombinase XerD